MKLHYNNNISVHPHWLVMLYPLLPLAHPPPSPHAWKLDIGVIQLILIVEVLKLGVGPRFLSELRWSKFLQTVSVLQAIAQRPKALCFFVYWSIGTTSLSIREERKKILYLSCIGILIQHAPIPIMKPTVIEKQFDIASKCPQDLISPVIDIFRYIIEADRILDELVVICVVRLRWKAEKSTNNITSILILRSTTAL
jgi:hypothetical protein